MKYNYEIFNETDYDLDNEIKDLKDFLNFVLKKEKIEDAEFNIIFVNNEKIHEINKEYRNVDRVTDVISFALEDNKTIELEIRLLGDIYISIDKAKEQAEEYGHSFKRELTFLSIHGLLHLLGYDHMEQADERIMFKKQEDLLNEFGITR